MSTRWFCGTFITFVVVLMLAGCKSSDTGQPTAPQPSLQQAAATTRSITAHTEDAANHTSNPGHNDGDHCFEREKAGVKRDLVLTITAQEISANNLPTVFLVDFDPNNRAIIPESNFENASNGSVDVRLHDAGTPPGAVKRNKSTPFLHLGPGPYVAGASVDTTMLRGNGNGVQKQPAILTFPYVTFVTDPSECPVLNLQSNNRP